MRLPQVASPLDYNIWLRKMPQLESFQALDKKSYKITYFMTIYLWYWLGFFVSITKELQFTIVLVFLGRFTDWLQKVKLVIVN